MSRNEIQQKSSSYPDLEYEVRDAMRTIMRAGEHVRDKGLMKEVKKHAAKHAREKEQEAAQARQLARRGMISDRQMTKLDKTAPLAAGNEGDSGSSTTMRGVTAN